MTDDVTSGAPGTRPDGGGETRRATTRRGCLTSACACALLVAGCAGRESTDGGPPSGTVGGSPTGGTATRSNCPDDRATVTYDPESPCELNVLSDLQVSYRGEGTERAVLQVTEVDTGETVLDRRVTLGAETVRFEDPIRSGGRYRVVLRASEDLRGEYVWTVPRTEARTDSHGLRVSVDDETVTFEEVVR